MSGIFDDYAQDLKVASHEGLHVVKDGLKIHVERPAVRIALLGDRMVGKSCLKQMFLQGVFQQNYIKNDFEVGVKPSYSKKFLIHVLDVPGRMRNEPDVVLQLLKTVDAVLLVFDVTQPSSFKSLWYYAEIKPVDLVSFIVANKTDLKRQVTVKMQQKMSKDLGILSLNSSAKSNVDHIFCQTLEKILSDDEVVINDESRCVVS